MQIRVSDEDEYILLRMYHEYSAAISNLSFMLSLHQNDTNDSFLKSIKYEEMKDKLIEKYIQKQLYEQAIVKRTCELHGYQFPKFYRLDDGIISWNENIKK